MASYLVRSLLIVVTGLMLSLTTAAGQDAAEGTPANAETVDWDSLRRPLDLPELAPGAPCPRTDGRRVTRQFGFALGDGPVYPASLGPDGVLNYGGAREEGGWFYQKVLWFISPDYAGPILIRGRQLDGPNEVRFERGINPPAELRIEGGEGSVAGYPGWLNRPSYTRLRAPGCYAYQVDGEDFSEVIVFQAVEESPSELTPVPRGEEYPLPDELGVSSGVRLDDVQVRLALTGGKYLVIRLEIGPTQAEPLDLPSGDVQRLDTEAGTVLWEADPEYGWPRVATWDDGRHRYQLEVLDGDRDAWSGEDLVTLVEAFAAAPEPSAGS